ncbi:MAG: hypothetical protein ACP5NC_06720 [Nitrososphaeria archaeon]
MDIYRSDKNFQTAYNKIDDPDLKAFINYIRLQNYSVQRILKYINVIQNIEKLIKKPMRSATQEDLKRTVEYAVSKKP